MKPGCDNTLMLSHFYHKLPDVKVRCTNLILDEAGSKKKKHTHSPHNVAHFIYFFKVNVIKAIVSRNQNSSATRLLALPKTSESVFPEPPAGSRSHFGSGQLAVWLKAAASSEIIGIKTSTKQVVFVCFFFYRRKQG